MLSAVVDRLLRDGIPMAEWGAAKATLKEAGREDVIGAVDRSGGRYSLAEDWADHIYPPGAVPAL